MSFLHRFWTLHVFFVFVEYFCLGISIRTEVPSEQINASVILEAFCSLEYKLNVMECVDDETDSQALLPWKFCLNVDRNLSEKELITLSCKTLYPGYEEVFDILTNCVDNLMSPDEAASWMPILELCALRTAGRTLTSRTISSSVDDFETSSLTKFFATTT